MLDDDSIPTVSLPAFNAAVVVVVVVLLSFSFSLLLSNLVGKSFNATYLYGVGDGVGGVRGIKK